jgi:hypothetical protein
MRFALFLLLLLLLSSIVSADNKTGVGVLNVPPEYSKVRVIHQDNTIRVYLTISDYNSWEDIFKVDVALEYYGLETALFTFKQYVDPNSYLKINEFEETSIERDLLFEDKCLCFHSDKKETVEEKCNLDLVFVFRVTWFTRLKIVAIDREGEKATTIVEYNAEDLLRSSTMIMLPGLYEPIPVYIPSFFLNLIAIFGGGIGALYLIRKKG